MAFDAEARTIGEAGGKKVRDLGARRAQLGQRRLGALRQAGEMACAYAGGIQVGGRPFDHRK